MARFCINPDDTGPSLEGPLPATGAVAALITKATGKAPYVAGNHTSETSAMIGDRMDTRSSRAWRPG
ncbi:hypothetical protein GCM10010261_65760 [Streptomyces pilosus]|nr:hypothetical protein GCM10010261_65760 [Streptomyces pilosus]